MQKLVEIAKKLKQEEAFSSWSEQQVIVGLRDECKCQYCGDDLLSSRSVAYCIWNLDHLLPKSKPEYAHLENELWNRVLCCGDCNSVKGAWDPNTEGGTPVYYGIEKAPPNVDEIRNELTRRSADYLRVRREPLLLRFVREQSIMRQQLRRLKEESSDAAKATAGS